jgi:hypothetical protein
MSTNSTTSESYGITMYNRISFWYAAIVLPIGITLTIITGICVYSKRILWSSKNNIVLLGFNLAIADCSVLVVNFLLVQLFPSINMDFMLISDFTCIFGTFWLKTIGITASWLQVNVAFNRFLTSYVPNRFHRFKTDKKFLQNIIFVIIIIIVGINSVNFCLYLFKSGNQVVCGVENQRAALTVDMLRAIFSHWIPLPLIFTFHFLNAVYVFRTRNQISSSENLNEEELNEVRNQRQTTFNVICLQGVFVFLNFPICIFLIISNVYTHGYNLPLTDGLLIFQAISICMANFFPITPFLMNIIINDDFKIELSNLFGISKKN